MAKSNTRAKDEENRRESDSRPRSGPLSGEDLAKIGAYWRAANYLSVGQVYLMGNPMLKEPLKREHVKPRLLGHWGTVPGLNFIYAHMNRVIKKYDLDAIYVCGPGHGGPGIVANTWLEGVYTELYPDVTQDEEGMRRLFLQFSFPGGVPSHVAAEVPGSIHEGGELGYAVSHAFGAAFDNPDLVVCCVVGDGEAETGALAASWHSNKFLNPAVDGAVLPILHLNGYKIANPTLLARIPREELESLFIGYGYQPLFVEGSDPAEMHQKMAAALDQAIEEIHRIQGDGRRTTDDGRTEKGPEERLDNLEPRLPSSVFRRPRWPMIILRSPKGWTCPKEVDGQKTENYWRSHQVPMGEMESEEHIRLLESWMKSYRPEELFDTDGRLYPELADLAPRGEKRMSASLHANGGILLRDLRMPDFRDHAVEVPKPGVQSAEATRVMGRFLRDVMKLNTLTPAPTPKLRFSRVWRDGKGENVSVTESGSPLPPELGGEGLGVRGASGNFLVFSPDENNSNRLGAILEVTDRRWMAETLPEDDHLRHDGRVLEILSETTIQGWLEGYLLTGRHGIFSCYEAFIHIVDSMVNQHAKWLKTTREIPWRRPIASLNYLLTSHVWRQDHNGFSHQDPGFIDFLMNKKADIVRVYLPPDANTLLSVTDHCLRSRNYINVIVAGKQPALQFLDMDAAIKHCTLGLGIWGWASNDQDSEPDVVMACAGEVPTMETLAAVDILRQHVPDLRIRVVNVVDLMSLQPQSEHPHGIRDEDFDSLFSTDKPIIFAYHGYPWLIHRLTYRRTGHRNMHVRGYKEEGTTTTPFDMAVLNDMDRFHLARDVVERVPRIGARAAHLKQFLVNKRIEHKQYIRAHGEDMPEVRNWKWPY